jgi:hypothetical protein
MKQPILSFFVSVTIFYSNDADTDGKKHRYASSNSSLDRFIFKNLTEIIEEELEAEAKDFLKDLHKVLNFLFT